MNESILSWIALLSYSLVPALGEGLWRGLLLAVSAGILLKVLRINASSRYSLWLLLLIAICTLPLFPFLHHETDVFVDPTQSPANSSGPFVQISVTIAAAILGSIFLISFFRVALLLFACRALSVLRKESVIAPEWLQNLLQKIVSQADIQRAIQIRLSSKIEAPALAGFSKPVVLFPKHLLFQLTPSEIEQILLHEVAHFQRHDDWAILVQRLLSAMFFFNPAVVWICKQLDFEREIACDDAVIQAGGTPQTYALCLTRLAEFSRPLASSPLLSASSQLSRRVDMLLNRSKKNSGTSILFATFAVFVLLAVLTWIIQASPLLAVADNEKPAERRAQTQDDFISASKRMKQAQLKMEEAREEMLQAAEAMRQAKEELPVDNLEKLKALRSFQDLTGLEKIDQMKNLKSMLKSEKKMRKVEKEIIKEKSWKRYQSMPELAPVPPNQPLRPPVPASEGPLLAPVPELPPAPIIEEMPIPPTPELAPERPVFAPELPPAPTMEEMPIPPTPEVAPEWPEEF